MREIGGYDAIRGMTRKFGKFYEEVEIRHLGFP
jgi:hypothetical protein